MKRIDLLKEAALKVGNESLVEELNQIEARKNNPNIPVMLPLVGEFSSGKTTLINSLTDSKALETATKPTTATIFEIHFGAPENTAEVVMEDGVVSSVKDIESLKNDKLTNAKVVTVFDKSTRVSPFTILVDTPGISSPDPRHQQTLVDFLPQADAILLVIDINQQLTKSLADFLKSASLSGIELNAILTKSDTKADNDIQAAKRYFMENCDLPIKNVVAVSAAKENLNELYELFKDIESRKSEILKKSNLQRLNVISAKLLAIIDTLLNAPQDVDQLEEEIREKKQDLIKVQRRIERVLTNIKDELEELTRKCVRKFEDQVSSKLTSLINGKSQNYDSEAVSSINSIASIILGEYRQHIIKILSEEVSRSSGDNELSLSALTGIDLSEVGIQGLNYDLDLNNTGHEYDKWIKGGIIAIGTAAAVTAVVASGGGASSAVAAVGSIDTVADVADTVSDVGSIVSNRKLVQKMETAVKFGQQATEKYTMINNANEAGVGSSGLGKGMIDSLAGFIAEKTMSKPQRSRAIRLYIDDRLMPEFKSQLQQAEISVVETVKEALNESAKAAIDETTALLQNLQNELKLNKTQFEKTKQDLREIQTKLLTL